MTEFTPLLVFHTTEMTHLRMRTIGVRFIQCTFIGISNPASTVSCRNCSRNFRRWIMHGVHKFFQKCRFQLQILGPIKVTWCRFQFRRTVNYKTDSMEQSPSWEANRSSASQEILRILWNHVHRSPLPVHILSKAHCFLAFSARRVWPDTHFLH